MSKVNININNNVEIPVGEQFRVASLNVLSSPHHYDIRFAMLAEEVRGLNPDVLMLQEVNVEVSSPMIEYLQSRTGLNYTANITPFSNRQGASQTVATLSKFAIVDSEEVNLGLPNAAGQVANSLKISVEFNGRKVYIYNVHLYWGGDNEQLRFNQVQKIMKHLKPVAFKEPDSLFIMGGDFNSLPDSMTLKYLSGKINMHDNEGVFWTDSATALNGGVDIHTTNAQSILGHETALGVGIVNPHLVPERRIDYILVRGFAYGRPGSPLTYGKWAMSQNADGLTISDHHGIYTDLYMP